ncbi:MAG: hypothetical protein Q9169_006924, partial [Polycauliona sp. 2 TL-2023]
MKQGQEASEKERQLAKLPFAVCASFNSYHHAEEAHCCEDTRVELLQQLREWGTAHPKPLYWLSGMGGTGKSTIARTLAHHFHSTGTLGGSFFFSRSSGETSNAVKFVGTLARHMAEVSPQLKKAICEAISSRDSITYQGLREQWKTLILEPLLNHESPDRTTLNFVIDALDECGSDGDIRLILQLFRQLFDEAKDSRVVDVGIFVTSRPEVAIRVGFHDMPTTIHQKLDLGDVPRQIIEHDLSVLIQSKLSPIGIRRDWLDWPKDEDIRLIAQQSDCLLISATTACLYIDSNQYGSRERLSQVIGAGSMQGGATGQLDKMYTQILTSSLISDRTPADILEQCGLFKRVVGSLVT